ncbi:hypothetical protein B0J13DRAFT_223947 [Dactylonectria estremocensis]|uniref:C2H2-type domain-containing protein n=1 Tax=Dactylonectria estremocensis TaxID=1079267 RepID=A0A9P9J7K9_9HYPO|nr:hypothetical protein B0J13DRAFT_223947 [Dactylonectria estremocensis]
MPSVRDKASQFSFHRHRSILSRSLPSKPRSPRALYSWIFPLKNRRLGCPESDMPRDGKEQAFVTREKASPTPSSPDLSSSTHENPPIGDRHQSSSNRDAEDRGQNRRGSSASRRRQAPPHQVANENTTALTVSQSPTQARRAADSNPPDAKLSAPSAAYLEYRVNRQLHYRKRRIVESLMAAIVECIEKKLEALEEGGDTTNQSSHPSSSGFRSGNGTSQWAGQKRHHRLDDDGEGSNGEDDSSSRKDNNKKAKMLNDDSRLRFACPYYKYDPQRFKDHRTCIGPGWPSVHRVKEHLKRSHSLPSHQCHRCFKYFGKDDELKKHQRTPTPCTIQDPATVCRDLADGFDQEQGKKLNKRVKMTPDAKWTEWYCILFKVDPTSSDIPSPYHDISYQSGGLSTPQATGLQEYREHMTRVIPVIRHHVELEVAKVIRAVEDDIKSNVMEVIRDLPGRIMAFLPPPGLPPSTQVPDDFLFTLDGLEFDLGDGYDFEEYSTLDPLAVSESSGSLDWSDPVVPSSATSVQDDLIPVCLGT